MLYNVQIHYFQAINFIQSIAVDISIELFSAERPVYAREKIRVVSPRVWRNDSSISQREMAPSSFS